MKFYKKGFRGFLLFGVFFFILAFSALSVSATAEISLATPGSYSSGQDVGVNLSVSGVTSLSGIQVNVSYNPSLFSYTTTDEGIFLSQGGTVATYFNNSEISASSGKIGNIIIFREGATDGASGSGVLATLHFTTLSSGSSYDMNITSALLSDNNGNSISFTNANSVSGSSGTTTSSSSGSGGGGGGGGVAGSGGAGAGVSTTPSIQQTQSAPASAGTTSFVFNFSAATGVKQVQVQLKTPPTNNVSVTISKYDSRPAAVPLDKPGITYRYFQFGNNIGDNLDKATTTLQVNDSWVSLNSLSKDNVALFEYDSASNSWKQISTAFKSSDSNYDYYTASLPSTGYFAIGDKAKVSVSIWLWIILGVLILIIAIIAFSIRRKRNNQVAQTA